MHQRKRLWLNWVLGLKPIPACTGQNTGKYLDMSPVIRRNIERLTYGEKGTLIQMLWNALTFSSLLQIAENICHSLKHVHTLMKMLSHIKHTSTTIYTFPRGLLFHFLMIRVLLFVHVWISRPAAFSFYHSIHFSLFEINWNNYFNGLWWSHIMCENLGLGLFLTSWRELK